MARSYPEYHLHVAIKQWLELCAPSVFFFHVPNGERRSAKDGAKLKHMGAKAGVPDFSCYTPNIHFWLEVKSDKGKPSKAQTEFADQMALCGVPVHVVRSIDGVREVMQRHGVPLKEVLA